MSKRARAEVSPSLFPFLAVLLCTVGALVLILVIVVSQSQASVKQATEARDDRAAELRAQVEVIRDSFREDRERIQLEIEKKRLSLQGLEQQANELMKELDSLAKTVELIDKKLTSEDDSAETTDAALTDLQKKMQEAAEALKSKLKNPTGNKPVFAIVPYEGSNGTHRRPIYLECRADGVVIQPEGVVIGLNDLRPPYGPGNPLDAALRTIRTHYAPKDGALNTSAYPLLVVRASGIRTYALARLAMAGWDDQFGYELIEDEMELSFPEGEPGLGKDIEQTLAAARNRQAALVMAMPGRYRRQMAELTDDDFQFEEGGGGGLGGGAEDGFGTGGESGSGSEGAERASDASGVQAPGIGGAAGRAGFAFAPDGGRSSTALGSVPASGASSGNSGAPLGFATGGESLAMTLPEKGGFKSGGWSGSAPAVGAPSEGTQSFADGAFSGNRYTRGPSGSGSAMGEGGGQTAAGNFDPGTSSSSSRPGTFRDAMTAARSKSQGNPESQSSQAAVSGKNASAADFGTGGSQTASPRSEGFGSISAVTGETGTDASAETLMTPSASLSARKKEKENAEAVAKRKGRNWAWSAGPARDTAVVRTIRVVCYEDRWLVLPEAGSKSSPDTVMLDVALQASAEELAKVIAARVDRWGFAMSSGYWKPVLEVEVAPGGERRFEQLRRLLDGSGLEIQPKAATALPRPSTK